MNRSRSQPLARGKPDFVADRDRLLVLIVRYRAALRPPAICSAVGVPVIVTPKKDNRRRRRWRPPSIAAARKARPPAAAAAPRAALRRTRLRRDRTEAATTDRGAPSLRRGIDIELQLAGRVFRAGKESSLALARMSGAASVTSRKQCAHDGNADVSGYRKTAAPALWRGFITISRSNAPKGSLAAGGRQNIKIGPRLLLVPHRNIGAETIAGIGASGIGRDVVARVREVLHVEDHVPGRRQ